jgi:oligosaccharide reducing-end xylanase
MKIPRLIPLAVGLCTAACAAAAPAGAFATGKYRNLFHEYLGKTDADVDARIRGAWRQIADGDPETQRLIYAIPGDMAYIPDVGNRDVRTEGLSYGMMIAVQLDHRKEFDELWRYARHFMYHEKGPFRGYSTWHTAYDGSGVRADGTLVEGGGPAPDGEEWFTTALFFAAHRWGDGGGILNYEAEAQVILREMLHKDDEPDHGPVRGMFDRATREVRFVPIGPGSSFTDPSYHLPAFYELWARWAAAPEDRAFMAEAARASRAFFRKAANPRTGLMPNFAAFDGTFAGRRGPDEFREDAWRTLSNPALDYSWWAADPWEVEEANRVLSFFASQPGDNWPDHIALDGMPTRTGEHSAGLYAMAASAALAADPAIGRPFVQRLWDMPLPDDRGRNHDGLRRKGELRSCRYYDGLLTMLGLLEVSGNFRIFDKPEGAAAGGSPAVPRS